MTDGKYDTGKYDTGKYELGSPNWEVRTGRSDAGMYDMGPMYETGTAVQVRAFHVMPGMPGPEGERHAHDYRLDVVVRRDRLDDRGMVVDLDALAAALRAAAGELDGADLDEVIGGRLSGDPVTVEHFAGWLHGRLAAPLGPLPGGVLAVRVWESPVAFGGYTAPF